MTNLLEKRVPQFIDLGPACLHDVQCWVCGKKSAIYLMNDTTFVPCDGCRAKIRSRFWVKGGVLYPDMRSLWEKLRDRFS